MLITTDVGGWPWLHHLGRVIQDDKTLTDVLSKESDQCGTAGGNGLNKRGWLDSEEANKTFVPIGAMAKDQLHSNLQGLIFMP